MTFGLRPDPAVEHGNLCQHIAPGLHERFEDRQQFGGDRQLACDHLLGAAPEPADPFTEMIPKVFRSPRTLFSSLTRMLTGASRAFSVARLT